MKKGIKTNSLVIMLLVTSLMVAPFGCLNASAKKASNLKLGVISDVHIGEENEKKDYIKVLNDFKKEDVDVVLMAGDITNDGTPEQYKLCNECWNEVFPNNSTSPKKAFVMGNHDERGTVQQFMDGLELTGLEEYDDKCDFHLCINGYHIIGISAGYGISADKQDWLKKQLAIASNDDPNKPIYVTSHCHIAGTVYGSNPEDGGWGYPDLYPILAQYPQVIHFSGHSHFVLEDERSINQRDFTAVGTSTLRYTELEPGKLNGSVPPDAYNVCQGMIVDNYNDKVTINRRNYAGDTPVDIKDNKNGLTNTWEINVPIKKENFTYTNNRAEKRNAPSFAVGSKIDVTDVGQTTASIKFDTATHEDFVHTYQIDAYNKSTGKIDVSNKYFSDFYLGINKMKKGTLAFNLGCLTKNTDYELRAYAIESFGKMSEPIIASIRTTGNPKKEVSTAADIFQLNLSNNLPLDSSSFETDIKLHGNVNVQKDTDLKRNVINFSDNGYMELPSLCYDQRKMLGTEFSIEIYAKPNGNSKNKDMSILCNNTGKKGFNMLVKRTGEPQFIYNTHSSHNAIFDTTGKFNNGWHHYVVTCNGYNIKYYQDGNFVKELNLSEYISPIDENSLLIGASQDQNSEAENFFTGSIADFNMYSNALSSDEIKEMSSLRSVISEDNQHDNDSSSTSTSEKVAETSISSPKEKEATESSSLSYNPSNNDTNNQSSSNNPITGDSSVIGFVSLEMLILCSIFLIRKKNKK